MTGKTINDMKMGDYAEFTKTVAESDVYGFAGITGDFNPAHIDEEYAKTTFFKKRIAHGMLSAGFISNVLGTKLPGAGAIYMKQEIAFLAPVYIGDTITARAEVVDMNMEKNRVTLKTTCTNQEGKMVVDGTAVLSPRKA
ncbi:MAG: MaoC family dehydratase [Desulfobacteraceae bacterium]|jgi:3-hydroxybutyryl-CoA dehydratase